MSSPQAIYEAARDKARLETVESWMQEWFAARGATLARGQNYFDANAIDSFGVIEMIEEIEDHFKVKFRQHDFQDRRFPSIAGLADIITERLLDELTAVSEELGLE